MRRYTCRVREVFSFSVGHHDNKPNSQSVQFYFGEYELIGLVFLSRFLQGNMSLTERRRLQQLVPELPDGSGISRSRSFAGFLNRSLSRKSR